MNKPPPESAGPFKTPPRQLLAEGLDLVVGYQDVAEELAIMTRDFRQICYDQHQRLFDVPRQGLSWQDPVPGEYVESVAVLMLLQITALGRAALVLHRDRARYLGTANPLTALQRPMFEALVYLDYLLAGDTSERYVDFVVSDVVATAWILERRSGLKRWSRQRDRTGAVRTRERATWRAGDDGVEVRADWHEAAWLRRRIHSLDHTATIEGLTAEDLSGLRRLWVQLGTRTACPDLMASWKARNNQWNSMKDALFGITVSEAIDRGRLKLQYEGASTYLPHYADAGAFLKYTGYTANHPFTHLTGKRIGSTQEADDYLVRTALFGVIWMMSAAATAVCDRYTWARPLRTTSDAVERAIANRALGARTSRGHSANRGRGGVDSR